MQQHPSVDQQGSSLVYEGAEYQRQGAICRRRVIVAPTAAAGEPEPKEIITSYGDFKREAT